MTIKWMSCFPVTIEFGGAKAAANPSMVVKGELDPDRPLLSRMWERTHPFYGHSDVPAANTTLVSRNRRRGLKGYWPRHHNSTNPFKKGYW